ATFERAPAAHLFELLLRHRLLREEGCLDPVEQAFEPADELCLRETQLLLRRVVAGEGQHDFAELLAEVGRQHAFELFEGYLVDLAEAAAGGVLRAWRA